MGDFKKLDAWVTAHELVLALYERTERFPRDERYGLTAQIRRAAISIPANLAEGCGRRGDRELRRFARIARGSAHELEVLLFVSKDLGLLAEAEWRQFEERVGKVASMLTGIVKMRPREQR